MLGVQRRLLDLLRALFLLCIPLGKAGLRTRKGRTAFVNNNNEKLDQSVLRGN